MTNKVRLSNFELLRIIALFFVLVFHSNFHTLGIPKIDEVSEEPLIGFSKCVVQGITVICVNVFVLLSGWFGIHPTLKGAFKLIFQVLFFMLGSYLVAVFAGWDSLSINGLANCFLFTDYAWFVKAYIGLYIISPILNDYSEVANKRNFRNLLIAFFIFQSMYGWATNAAKFFEYGFSTVSFIGLYLVARYIRRFSPNWSQWDKKIDLLVYFSIVISCAVFLVGISYIPQLKGIYHSLVGHMYAYTCPFVIIECIFVLLFFSKLRFKCSVVNFVAASAFSALFVHGNPYIFPYQEKVLLYYAENVYVVALIKVLWMSLLAFILSIILDQARLFSWKVVSKISC